MTGDDWSDAAGKSITMVISGTLDADLDDDSEPMLDDDGEPMLDDGDPMLDDDLAILLNAWREPVTCTLGWLGGAPVVIESDSFDRSRTGVEGVEVDGATLLVGARSVVLVRRGWGGSPAQPQLG